jgi:transposase
LGGRSTKIHAIVDSKGRPLNFTVTSGDMEFRSPYQAP